MNEHTQLFQRIFSSLGGNNRDVSLSRLRRDSDADEFFRTQLSEEDTPLTIPFKVVSWFCINDNELDPSTQKAGIALTALVLFMVRSPFFQFGPSELEGDQKECLKNLVDRLCSQGVTNNVVGGWINEWFMI